MASRAPTPVTGTNPADQPGATGGSGDNTGNGTDTTGANDTSGTDKADPARTVEARILRDHLDYRAGTFALVTEAEAKSGDRDWLDTDADAVAYAKAQDA